MNLFNILRSNKNRLKKGYPYWFWAIDLHDTIFKADYQPGSSGGNYFPGAKEALQLLSKDSSVKIILFSSSIKEAIEEAITRLQADGIIIDYINENPLVKDNNLFDKKFFMDVILDDKAGFEADYDWFAVMSEYQRSKKEYLNPTPTVDIVCENEKEELLFIQRKNEPIGWALPGGFIDYGEVAEDAARRELQEETGIKVDSKELRLIGVFSDPQRDPRMHTITIAYSCRAIGRAIAGDDANDAVFFSPKSLPTLAFDHGKIIDKYLNSKKLLTGE